MSTATTLLDETIELLQALIRLDTVNPPGNESLAAELLRDYLAESGVEADLIAREPGRANLVARLPGRGDGPRLTLLSHTDTVLADPAEWQLDPWSAELRDEEVWGRGALDMKGQVAASAVALASLAREGFRPNGDLIFVAAADEELGVDIGLPWLAREHADAVRCEYAINEGGGDRVEFAGRPFYLCSVSEKMTAPFRLLVRGRSGHASMPGIADNALLKASRLVTRLGEYRPEPRHTPETEALFRAVGVKPPAPEDAAAVAEGIHPLARALVEPLLSLTLAPTMIEASQKRNVIPARCEVVVDCRLQPGQQPEDVEPLIRDLLGKEDYELEWIERWGGTRSPAEGPLWEAVRGFVKATDPGADLIALGAAGFTDSHWLREAFGTVAYGFFPMRVMSPEVAATLVHSADERIHVEDLGLGLDFLRSVAVAIGALRT
jgi:acetylornithine deacetylase/succinyl-diaminopimelate desuccinylase-like protein